MGREYFLIGFNKSGDDDIEFLIPYTCGDMMQVCRQYGSTLNVSGG